MKAPMQQKTNRQEIPQKLKNPRSNKDNSTVMLWLVTLWPAIVTLLGAFYLHEAVAESVRSMPHPILLVAILVGTLVSWIAIILAQWRSMQEAKLAKRWSPQAAALQAPLRAKAAKSVFAPVYQLLSGHSTPPNPQQALQDEWANGESTLQGLLEFATFMGNALVGMGLVGTFVGLLGSLQDLSSVFTALIDGGGNAVSPTALFTDMITRLQLPMRAMGTAFVASLYGLLGSLVVALMMVGARKSIARSAKLIHHLVLNYEYQIPAQAAKSSADSTDTLADELAALKQDISALQQLRQQTQHNLQALHTEVQALAAVNLQQAREMQTPLLHVSQTVQQLSQQLQAQHTEAKQDAQQHSQQLSEYLHTLIQQLHEQQTQVLQESHSTSQRYSEALQTVTQQLQSQQTQIQQAAEQTSQHFSESLQTLTQQLQSQQTQAQQEANLTTQQLRKAMHALIEQLQLLHTNSQQESEQASLRLSEALQKLTQQHQTQQAQAQQEAQHTSQQFSQTLQALTQQLQAQQTEARQEAQQSGQQLSQALQSLGQQLQTLQTQAQQEAQHNNQRLSEALQTLGLQLQAQQTQALQEAQQEAQQHRQHLSLAISKFGQLLTLNNQGQVTAHKELLANFKWLEELMREQLSQGMLNRQSSRDGFGRLLQSMGLTHRPGPQKDEDRQSKPPRS